MLHRAAALVLTLGLAGALVMWKLTEPPPAPAATAGPLGPAHSARHAPTAIPPSPRRTAPGVTTRVPTPPRRPPRVRRARPHRQPPADTRGAPTAVRPARRAQAVPASALSRRVAKRRRPALARAFAQRGLRLGDPIFLRIFKRPAELELWVRRGPRFSLFKRYPICTFSGGLGPKLTLGDKQSPEGFYWVKPQRMNPWSRYHLAFNLGYPNAYDRYHRRTGRALMVHGDCVSIGCYAMTNEGIEEIYTIAAAALRAGQPFFRVHIFPFPLTDERLDQRRASPHHRFWRNLQAGYLYFERTRRPPDVTAVRGHYYFNDPDPT